MTRKELVYRFGDALTFIGLMVVLLIAPGMFL
jgi:hypothetical protein